MNYDYFQSKYMSENTFFYNAQILKNSMYNITFSSSVIRQYTLWVENPQIKL